MSEDRNNPPEVSRIDIAEFRRLGYLQEVNRRVLHPLGLALEVHVAENGTETLGGVWDYRDDPEGIRYEGVDLSERAGQVQQEWDAREPARRAALGYMVQPSSSDDRGTPPRRDDGVGPRRESDAEGT